MTNHQFFGPTAAPGSVLDNLPHLVLFAIIALGIFWYFRYDPNRRLRKAKAAE